MLLMGLKSYNVLFSEEPSRFRVDDSQIHGLEALVVDVLIDSDHHITQDLLFGDDCIIQVVEDMDEEKMGNFVGDHFFERLLN